MSFIVRAAARADARNLYELARQFTLLNLPADKRVIEAKIERSLASFRGDLGKDDAEYLFVLEDQSSAMLVGSSLILAKNGTATQPNFSFKILKKEHFSKDLGVGFIHQILRLSANTDGPTEVGGLVVDRGYRGHGAKVGRLISLSRFVYIGMQPARFEDDLHSEMVPPLTEHGQSEFWEALGRRFTGMPYQEADQISGQNNLFIPSLFPTDDIYLALLDTKARLVLGRVGEETQGALKLLNRIGFTYKDEVDPFDGGPHLGCRTTDCTLIKNLRRVRVTPGEVAIDAACFGLIGLDRGEGYLGTAGAYALDGGDVRVSTEIWSALNLSEGEELFVTELGKDGPGDV